MANDTISFNAVIIILILIVISISYMKYYVV